LGANVVEVREAGQRYSETTIIDHVGRPYTVRYLVTQLNIPEWRIYFEYDPASPVDVELILGDDWAASNSLP